MKGSHTLQALASDLGPCPTLEYTFVLPNWHACSMLGSGLMQGISQEAGLERSNLPRHLHDKESPEHEDTAEFRQP